MTPDGQRLGIVRIDNDPVALAAEILKAGPCPEVLLEATYGWYWAADVLVHAGASVHLAQPLGVKGFAYRWEKNDERDAADLLRMHCPPEAYLGPPEVRALRETVRHRAKLVAVRSGLKAQARVAGPAAGRAHRSPRPARRDRRDRPQAAHARLLRAVRRPHPRSHRPRGGVSRLGRGPARGRALSSPPLARRGRPLD
jgi:hypothetical protein